MPDLSWGSLVITLLGANTAISTWSPTPTPRSSATCSINIMYIMIFINIMIIMYIMNIVNHPIICYMKVELLN